MFKILLKKQLAELKELYFPRKLKKGGEIRRSKGMAVLFVFLYLTIALGLGAMMWPMCESFQPLGLSWLYFMMVFFMGVIVGVVGSVFSAYTTLYHAKDNEMLLAMPIRPLHLLLSRMVSVFLTGFAFVLIACLPAIAVYMILYGVSFKLILGCLSGLLALGMIVSALTCFFGWIVALFSGITRHKSLTTTLVSLLLMAVYYVVYFKISDFIRYMIENALFVSGKIEKNAYVLKLIGQGFLGQAAGIGIMLGLGVVLLALTVFMLTKSFNSLLTRNRGTKKVVYHEKSAKQSKPFGALLRREFTHFGQSPAYLLNTALGLIIMLGAIVYLLIRYADASALMTKLYDMIDYQLDDSFAWVRKLIAFAPAILVCFLVGMSPISAPSISIEGQNMWILRMLPVRDRDIFLSKQALQLVLELPVTLAATLILTSLTDAGALIYVTNTLTVLCFVLLQTALGLTMALKKPMLNWTNETQAVKQGLAVSITLLAGMLIPLVMGFGSYLLRKVFDITPLFWILLAACALLLNRWIFTKGGSKLAELG